ncbi:glycosyltransferase family 2 protein [Maribellus maritimus]|uniref:glycosyltransferase family 2 protein n=1 Tax=Maribellus maritimus TaxID=2870838 RepID=UPI001EECD03A|nr:glycosyltransferase family 2 protein [Maribellus maritimus]MCG6190244.1 glycosyltransferase family 2 protein [Maribellus maritimus]
MTIYTRSKIGVLLTCFNRKEKTMACLSAFFKATNLVSGVNFDVFLVDDGSTDGTSEAVKNTFPGVKTIKGSGNLFWNGGMRLAWSEAAKNQYNFYMWLNDDTILSEYALNEMLECYSLAEGKDQKPALIVGACVTSGNSGRFSYGGRSDEETPVIPNGDLQSCKYINGNIVLVADRIFEELGNLSSDYTHAMGDIDYGLRALKKGFSLYTTRNYVAVCELNEMPAWHDPKFPFSKRWELVHSPKGLNLKEYNKFRKKFWGRKWIIYAFKVYLKVIFPQVYNRLLTLK